MTGGSGFRFAHEMNGDWYPWSVGSPGGSPQDYVAAYRRVRGMFDDAGAKHVEWVWCPNVIVNGNVEAISRCYPGDDFVDIVGVDGYNFGDLPGHRWTQPAELFGDTVALVAQLAPGKPVWINEVGCGDQRRRQVALDLRFHRLACRHRRPRADLVRGRRQPG